MKMKRLANAWGGLVLAVLLAGCEGSTGNPQFSQMPEGRVQRFYYHSARELGSAEEQEPISFIELCRTDSLPQGGLLRFGGESLGTHPWTQVPQPVVVGEEVFDSLQVLVSRSRLYTLCPSYSAWLKGDAYAYVPWNLEIVFDHDTLRTESDGTRPSDMDEFYASMDYLEKVARERGLEWLARQPIELDEKAFSDLSNVFEPACDTTTGERLPHTFDLRPLNGEKEAQRLVLHPSGFNCYTDQATGKRLEARWVADELMLVCRSSDGQPQWAMSAHENAMPSYDTEWLLRHVIEREYLDSKGRKVVINDERIKGFEGRGEERLVLMPYRDMTAERFRTGEYPDERFYAFRRSESGINVYATQDDSDEDHYYDVVPTDPIELLRFTDTPTFDWLHKEVLDSYILHYYSPSERQLMRSVVEKATSPTPQDEWNLWLLKEFAKVIPFAPEKDYKK